MTAEVLGAGRAAIESRMDSRVNVRRTSGSSVQDEDSGIEVPEWTTVFTDLPFRLKGGRSRTVTIGGIEFEEATAEGDMPAATHNLADNDLLEITVGEWAGTVWRIVEAVKGDQRTARRVPIVEAARPSEWDA